MIWLPCGLSNVGVSPISLLYTEEKDFLSLFLYLLWARQLNVVFILGFHIFRSITLGVHFSVLEFLHSFRIFRLKSEDLHDSKTSLFLDGLKFFISFAPEVLMASQNLGVVRLTTHGLEPHLHVNFTCYF